MRSTETYNRELGGEIGNVNFAAGKSAAYRAAKGREEPVDLQLASTTPDSAKPGGQGAPSLLDRPGRRLSVSR